jgi:CheY-like chemotaxis protein
MASVSQDAPIGSAGAVLLVDDSRFVRASMRRSLGGTFSLRETDSGDRAWEMLLLDESIAAVLSDLSMPGLDGFQLLQRVRGSMVSRIRHLPFAILSGAHDEQARSRAQALGADRFVLKGDDPAVLRAWLMTVLQPGADHPASPEPGTDAPVRAEPVSVQQALHDWLLAVFGRLNPSVQTPGVVFRLHAQGVDDLPGRLRRGIRAADALHLEAPLADATQTAWLCAVGSSSHALRLALRFAVLAAGREAAPGSIGARIEVCLQPIDPLQPLACLQVLGQAVPVLPLSPGMAMRCAASGWGSAWECQLPWPAARLLVSV